MKIIKKLLLLFLLLYTTLGFCNNKPHKIFEAIQEQDLDYIEDLVNEGAKFYIKNSQGESALHEAVKTGDVKIVRLLLKGKRPFTPTDRFLLALPVAGVVAVIFLILAFFMGMVYSHKLAGPIYRIEKSILQLLNGVQNFRVTLRKKDEFKKLADTMNRMVDYFKENSQVLLEIRSLIKEFEKNQDQGFLDKAQDLLNQKLEELEGPNKNHS